MVRKKVGVIDEVSSKRPPLALAPGALEPIAKCAERLGVEMLAPTPPAAVSQERLELEKELAERTGYKTRYSRIVDHAKLAQLLSAHGLAPLSNEAVEKYKASKRVGPSFWAANIDEECVGPAGVALAGFGLMIFIIGGLLNEILPMYIVGLFLTVVGVCLVLAALKAKSDRKRSQKLWLQTRLCDFTGIVPLPVLQLAAELREAGYYPNVDYLSEQAVRNPDPFLYVQVAAGRIYVAVWDEKDFDNELWRRKSEQTA